MEIIYLEKMIASDTDDFSIERQKNEIDGKWYGLSISRYDADFKKDSLFADGEEWIKNLHDMKYGEFIKINNINEYYIVGKITKAEFKTIRGLVRRAKELGWF